MLSNKVFDDFMDARPNQNKANSFTILPANWRLLERMKFSRKSVSK